MARSRRSTCPSIRDEAGSPEDADLATADELREQLRPIVAEWFEKGYDEGRLATDELTNRVLALLRRPAGATEPWVADAMTQARIAEAHEGLAAPAGAGLRAAVQEAVHLTAGPGNGTVSRQRPIEEWRRLDRLFRAALAAPAEEAAGLCPVIAEPTPHRFEVACTACGQPGQITVSVAARQSAESPETAPAHGDHPRDGYTYDDCPGCHPETAR